MNPLRWKQIKQTFEEAIAQSESERASFLASTCGADAALRTEVESLLSSLMMSGKFLEPPAPDTADMYVGRHFGPYHVERLIGFGGMGSVYEGMRDDGQFTRRVAIKVARSGAWSKELVVRFHQERQTLAQLEHPNIAKLLDGATSDDGIPYLVMEYIDGVPIDQYCDKKGLNVHDRLNLFRTVCDAVQYAHQNLVVHRDLKPGNILVTDDGVPKLLDFGIAKLLDEASDSQTGDMTSAGIRFTTPEYASPEQIRGETITTASDVYSLGVLLYQLLTGTRPYAFKTRFPLEITRVVTEEQPRKPSTKAVQDGVDQPHSDAPRSTAAHERAERRGTTPEKLSRMLVGDLDTIVAKALHKDPHRRYASVTQLADDIHRHVVGLPVLARGDPFGYRTVKFVQRHKIGVIATLVVILSLIGGLIGVSTQAHKAQLEARKAEHISQFLQEMLASADPAKSGKDVTVAELLEDAVKRVDIELKDQPEVQLLALSTIGETYTGLGLYEKSEREIRRGLSLARTIYGGAHPEVAKFEGSLAYIFQRMGAYASADSLFAIAVGKYRKGVSEPDKYLASMLSDWGSTLHASRQNERALKILGEAIETFRTTENRSDRDYAVALSNIGPALQDANRFAAAESVYREALEIERQQVGLGHLDASYTMNNLAFVFIERRQLDSAESMFRQSLAIRHTALGDQHPEYAAALSNLGGLLLMRGKLDEAEKQVRASLSVFEKTVGKENLGRSSAEYVLGRVLVSRGDARAAEPVLRDALTNRKLALPPSHPVIAKTEMELGRCLLLQNRFGEAEVQLREALQVFRASGPRSDSLVTNAAALLRDLYVRWGKKEKLREVDSMFSANAKSRQ